MDGVENISVHDINRLPVNLNQVPNDSCHWNQFHSFVLHFNNRLRSLDHHDWEIYVNERINDDHLAMIQPPVVQLFRAAFSVWRNYGEKVKEAWGHRADRLNKLSVPGLLKTLPEIYCGSCNDNEHIRLLIYNDWKYLCHLIRVSIRCGSRNIEVQNNEYLFGNKRVEIGTQIVCFSITLPYFVRK